MKTIQWNVSILLILILLLFITPFAALAQKDMGTAELEVDQLIQQSNELFQQEQYEQSATAAMDAVSKAEAVFGQDNSVSVMAVYNLAGILNGLGELEQALTYYEKAYSGAQKAFGVDKPETMIILSELGMVYGFLGQYEKAKDSLEKAYEFQKSQLGPTSPELLPLVNSLAQMYQAMGLNPNAEKLLTVYIDAVKGNPGADQTELLFTQDILAAVYTAQGNFIKAEPLYQEVLKQKMEDLGENNPETQITMSSLAELYRQLGKFKESEELFTRAVGKMRETQGDQNPDFYQAIGNLAALYEDIGKYDKAEELYMKVLDYDKTTLGEAHPNSIVDMDKLAGLYRRKGDYGQAETTYQTTLELIRKALGENHPQTITVKNNLALLNENQGFYEKAEPIFKDGLKSSEKINGKKHPTTLALMNNLALLYESQGNFQKSEPLYQNVIMLNKGVYGNKHPNTIAGINNLGYLYLMQREYKKAEPLFAEVLSTWKEQFGLKHQKTLKALNNSARVAHHLGNLDDAETMLAQALTLRKEVMGERHPDVVRSQVDLSALYITRQKYNEAEVLLLETLKLSEEILGVHHQYTFEALNSLSDLYEKSGQDDQSLLMRKKGFLRRNQFFDRVLWGAGEETRQNYISLHKEEQDKFITLIMKLNRPDAAKMALDISLQRKGLLLKISSEIQKILDMSDDLELSEIAGELEGKRKILASMTLSGPVDETPAEFHAKTVQLEEEVNDLQAEVGRKSAAFRNASEFVSVDELFEGLGSKDVLVDYLAYNNETLKMMAIVAKKVERSCYLMFTCVDNQINLIDLGELEDLHKGVTWFREAIQSEDAEPEELDETSMNIYAKAWAPFESIIGELTSIYLVPDSTLHLLPFDAMINSDGIYMIQAKDLKIISSSRDIVIPSLPASSGEFVIVAGPDYDLDSETLKEKKKVISGKRAALTKGLKIASHGLRSLSFEPLDGAELEGKTIKKVFENSTASSIYIKRDAEEQLLRTFKSPPSMLHIATHGFFLQAEERLKKRLLSLQRGSTNKLPPPGDNPMLRAGLAFAGVNNNAPFLGDIDTNNDGVLTALEVLSLKLAGTRIVVLSACETGVGEIHAGEGVYGLRRSFQEAGVISVVNSLWPVSDEGTRRLMTGFYNRVYKDIPAREALKGSQLDLIKSDDWNHPYFWAAFVMVDKPNK